MNDFELNSLKEKGILSSLDVHFAQFMAELSKNDDPLFVSSIALASNWTSRGHICVDLPFLAGKPLPIDAEKPPHCPSLDLWKSVLKGLVIGKEGDFAPLILDQRDRLYLYRYWEYQDKLAKALQYRLRESVKIDFPHLLKSQLESLFPRSPEMPDWQKVAALTAMLKSFCVIAGGPGTGKTSTVVKILALLQMQSKERLNIALVAPTGKAAMRLRQSIIAAKKHLSLAQQVPEETFTIHRFLSPLNNSPYFRFNELKKIPVDVVVVDEASMVDLALMSKLVQALKPDSRLILLGDKDQLASVEAGAVLGDLCHDTQRGFSKDFQQQLGEFMPEIKYLTPLKPASTLQDVVVSLKHSYRFDSKNKIGRLAQAVNHGNADQALEILKETGDEVVWLENSEDWKTYAQEGYTPYLQLIDNPEKILEAFQKFRVLCAHRQGQWGVSSLNRQIEELLGFSKQYQHYAYRPVMITENAYGLRLFNGDTGILLHENQRLIAYFENTDGGYRHIPSARLPAHETAFVMTIHKSQGSEFEKVLLLLPDQVSPILTRELLYTGMTRTKQRLLLVGSEQIIRAAISTRIQRSSGLHDALNDL
jgi:exodeoxyribonuclease V alpha subunit